jgi:hypothetical protein
MLLSLLATALVFSAVPRQFEYQGKLTDDSGVGINGRKAMIFKIYNVETGGMALWSEVHTGTDSVTVRKGLFHVILGEITPLVVAFDEQYWLQIEVNETVLSPRVKIVPSFYAFRAAVADSVVGGGTGGEASGWLDEGTIVHLRTGTDSVGIGTLTPQQMLTMASATGDIAIQMQSGTGAAPTDETDPSVAANDASIGTVAWTDSDSVLESDDFCAKAVFASAGITQYLKVSGFGFALPTHATITGIQVFIERRSAVASTVCDTVVSLVKSGAIAGDNKAVADFWIGTDADQAYGGSSDLWGETWTAADINDADFGVVISAKSVAISLAYIDHIGVKVYFATEQSWTMGIDESDESRFKIASSNAPGSEDKLTLDLDGNASFSGRVSGQDAVDDNEFITRGQIATGAVGFWSPNGNDIYNTNAGNVGIGTTSPASKFTITGGITSNSGLGIRSADVWTVIRNYPSANYSAIDVTSGGSESSIGTSGYPLLLNPSGGAVGVGTTSPAKKLDVVGEMQTTGTGNNYFAGNVGIGTASPTNKLQVVGGADTAIYATCNAIAVYGESSESGYGVYGSSGIHGIGVYGYNSFSGSYGYLGGDEYGVYGYSNEFFGFGVYGENSYGFGVYGASGNGYGVYGQGSIYGVYASGNLGCSGTKPSVNRIGDDAYELYAMESPNLWFEDFGEMKLIDGRVHVNIEKLFLQVCAISDEHPLQVFITPYGNIGNYYIERGKTGFTVVQIGDGDKNAAFGYRIVAKRKGYENLRMKKVDVQDDPFLYPELNPPGKREHNKDFRGK